MIAAQPQAQDRGSELLLEHCAAFARLHTARPAAFERLQALVGTELARLLVIGLAAGPRRRGA